MEWCNQTVQQLENWKKWMQIQIKGKVLWTKQRDNPTRGGEDEVNRVFKTRKIDRFIDTLPAITPSLIPLY